MNLSGSKYEMQAVVFMAKHGIKRDNCIKIGTRRGCFGTKDHSLRLVTISHFSREPKAGVSSQEWTVEFHSSANERRIPTCYEILAAITKSDPLSLDEFADEYGLVGGTSVSEIVSLYKSVKKEWGEVSAFFTEDEIKELQEIN